MQARPHVEVNTENAKPVEKFMHEVLRPVLKMLNGRLIASALGMINSEKENFENLSADEKRTQIQNLVSHNQKFKTHLKEMVTAEFSKDESIFYQKNKRDLNKRIFSMTLERLISQIVK